MMAQYLEIKAEHQGAILFYRMGDFYEMFFQDAHLAAEALDIALTKRGKHQGKDISMCGVPYHAAEGYLLTLIRKGFRVAIAEQMENPAEAKKRGYKSVVRREVVRLVTPGTLTEDSLLEPRRHNFLAAFAQVRDACALSWVDISTGEFSVTTCPLPKLAPELARLAPRELLVMDEGDETLSELLAELGTTVTPATKSTFDSASGEKKLCNFFNVTSLEAFGGFGRAELSAMGAVLNYLDLTQRGNMPLLRPPVKENLGGVMQIDGATRRNLELTSSLSGAPNGALLTTIDRTITASGARLLERRLSSPSCDLQVIEQRLQAVKFLLGAPRQRDDWRVALRRIPDIDRALSRLALGRGGPRDLAAIRNGLEQAQAIFTKQPTQTPKVLAEALAALGGFQSLLSALQNALVAEPPLITRDGGFIASSYDAELDQTRLLRDEGRGVIARMQVDYMAETGINTLKIKHNNVLGYFIETTATYAKKMLSEPLSARFIHRQTTAGQVRFTTLELSELEARILNSANHVLDIEKRLFFEISTLVLYQTGPVAAAARALAELDLVAGLADLAASENWVAPKLDQSRCFDISGGRHPVVERALRKQSGAPFVANDCTLNAGDHAAICLLTGPNMAGKSTFLRQNALIAILAQMGSFVPATSAHIGLVSQVFSRVGASDDLARGRSTFMVEMVETAAILNQADDRSLVILDEIGRGTATYDGLSIAWATLEHLHDVNKCRGLFATHYHEITALSDRLPGVENATVSVKEWQGDVIFLHEVRKGVADRSYGVQVARLAGLPPVVIARAKFILATLESGAHEGEGKAKISIDDLPLFSACVSAPQITPQLSALEDRMKTIFPDSLTPIDALSLLYELRALADSKDAQKP
jgi:DNA mismatch repair protein MutS